MSIDVIGLDERAAILAALWGLAWLLAPFYRRILGWGAVVLFLFGHWGWALVLLIMWGGAESEHRRWMAEEHACGFDRGRWID